MKKWLILVFLIALGLRLFRLGSSGLKEDEFTTQKAVSYINFCYQDPVNCRNRETTLKSRIIALVTNNETRPNLFTEIYLWDFIKDQPGEIHHSRAWPYLHFTALIQRWLGDSEFFLRLAGAVAGALIVPAGFIFSRYFSGSAGAALTYSFLLAAAFPLIDYSRNARMYGPFITCFLMAAYLWHRLLTAKRPGLLLILSTILISLLAYWLHSLTLLLFIGIYIFSFFKARLWFWLFSGLLLGYTLAGKLVGVDFFHTYFLGIAWPPQWPYWSWFYVIGLGLLAIKKQFYLLGIALIYLIVVTFFTSWRYGSAYAIALWPIMLLPFLTWRRWLAALTVVAVGVGLILKINYIYFGRDGQARIKAAYQVIKDNFEAGDKIYAVLLRDYYLQDLPANTEVIDLLKQPDPEFSGSGFVVWEQEKAGHFKPEVLEYVTANFQNLSNNGVAIYQFNL